MKQKTNKSGLRARAALFACFALVLALPLGAQTAEPQFSAADLEKPAANEAYTPRSGVFEASMGTISSDVDSFMSVFDFSNLKPLKLFGYMGLDGSISGGLNGGFGTNIGKVYLGISYGGTAIGEVVRLIPDQNMVDNVSHNSLNVLVGFGIVGIKLGFSEYIEAEDFTDGNIREISLKPSLEAGFNIKTGPIQIRPAIRGAFDLHNYHTTTTVGNDTQKTLTDFTEPSVGLTLGFDFLHSEKDLLQLDIAADGAMRLYKSSGKDGISATLTNAGGVTKDEASKIGDVRVTANTAIHYRRNFNQRLTLGIKAGGDVSFDYLKLPQTSASAPDFEYTGMVTALSITPNLDVGAQVNLIPEHFSLYAGLGASIMTFSQSDITDIVTKISDKTSTKTVTNNSEIEWMPSPSPRAAIGLKLNFTANTAIDLLARAEGLDLTSIESTKFTALFTMKK
ncbi:hypothetical protein FACS1894109_14030 [Spirochaetia bacterium]|nr:hypothetical protein FACS1894109_14030 [Spirochaetia bacterium]